MLFDNCSIIILGCQWGDEGKAKILDYLMASAKAVVRFQGGHNAEHSVLIGKERITLQLIPSGILREGVICFIGQGVLVSPQALCKEILGLAQINIAVGDNLKISPACALVLPSHVALDQAREKKRGFQMLGTTGLGMGPAYEDKLARRGLRILDLFNEREFKTQLFDLLGYHNFLLKNYYQQDMVSIQQTFEELMAARDMIAPFILEVPSAVRELRQKNQTILFEGSQGTLLDIDHGTYPFVTPSNTVSGAAAIGSGLGMDFFDHVLGVTKAYCTRVGKGPFPTEQKNAIGEWLANAEKELGHITGRQKRCGWLDLVALRFAIQVNGLSSLCLTGLNVLDMAEQINICTGYRLKGELIQQIPLDSKLYAECEPVYQTFKGWQQKTTGIRHRADLPSNARAYLNFIEDATQRPIALISTGSEREMMICRDGNIGS